MSALDLSRFDTLMRGTAVPALDRWFGEPAQHRPDGGLGTAVTVTIQRSERVEPVGDYGERAETRVTFDIATAAGVAVGDTLETGDGVVWLVGQRLLESDRYLTRFAVREADPS